MASPICPNCSKDYVRRVRREGLIDRLVSLTYVYPFRCQLCGCRFRVRQQGVRYTRVDEDRREYERIPVRFPVILFTGQDNVTGTALDISMAGCTVETTASLPAETVLRVQLEAPDLAPLQVQAAVVRSVRTKSIGLQFLRFEGNERERLQSFVRTLLFMPKP
jgi:hypothetical protein